LETSLFVRIGQRYIDLKVWAIDGYLSEHDFKFWKSLPIVLGYYYDSLNQKQSQFSGSVSSGNSGTSTAEGSTVQGMISPRLLPVAASQKLEAEIDTKAKKEEEEEEEEERTWTNKVSKESSNKKRGRAPLPVSALKESV
jgi:hypothetical protein